MAQLNINITTEFEKDLKHYMKLKGFDQKSEAVRKAVQEALQIHRRQSKKYDFRQLLGLGLKAPLNPHPQFKSEDDLWEK